MLAFLGPRRLQHPLHSLRTRSLTYSHKPIPTYKTVWDHTTHRLLRPKLLFTKWKLRGRVNTEDSARKAERQQLRDAYQSRPIALVRRCDPLNSHVNHALKRLNHLIGLADTKRSDGDLRRKLWRAYALAKHSTPDLPFIIPERAWDILWATQSMRSLDNPSREIHLKELYHDMRWAGASVKVGERTAYLEDIFLNGGEELALKEWEDDHGLLGSFSRRHDYRPEHLEVGARMYALAGYPDRARNIMEELFDLYPTWNPSVMMIVFRVHTSMETVHHHDLAKDLYIKMKARLGKKATLGDYDAWLTGFLEARHLRYAKQVFGDMIKDGQLANKISPREVEKLLRRLHLLYRLGTDIQKMTNIALYVLSILPRVWHSELYGHWMQAATVMQAPEVAIQILEMMFTRGIVPQTFHFNLLLRNLLQTKDRERELRAENIGWHMIEVSRKAAAKNKKPTSEPTVDMIRQISNRPTDMEIVSEKLQKAIEAEKLQKATEAVRNADRPRKFPPADTTTFALVMRHHANHLQWEHVEYLARRIKEQKLVPNSTILNVLMGNQIRQGKYSRAWEIHKSFTNVPVGTPRVFPDGANFRCLWLGLRLALGDRETRYDSALPAPRQLLAETIRWWETTRNRSDAERFRIGLASGDHDAVTGLMIHCFSYTKDLPGSLVALHALRKRIDIFPSDKTADALQRQVAWADLTRVTSKTRAQYPSSDTFRQTVEKMGRIHDILKLNRLNRMGLTSDQFASMSKAEIGDLNLNLLSEFIRVVLKRQHPPEKVEAMIEEARKEVGLPDLVTGDMDVFSVA